ncbi:biotin--[acetyl-CoA-carboxylase] ligase [Reichenbachiella versicolor]|uniref:biotin--[acetyl-CoA-carboxylase] ligase n=1 Tax=Reichenbachiella versicolor TaxID=1821036 RepID=UPI000D6E5C7C|nr:biotin--[acetyl-CoA-carboxylase] ligase [Reichenbachiella versicolor]
MYKYFAKTQFLGKRVFFLSQCHSTNDEAAKYAKETPDFPEGTTFITSHQTNGRGQRGNEWISPAGQNATFSFLLKPKYIPIDQQFDLNIIVSLGIRRALRKFIGNRLKIKWPNDIYVGDKKMGGILIENTLKGNKIESTVVGIGLNVNQSSFEIDNATSFKLETSKSIEPNEMIENILIDLEEVYAFARVNGLVSLKTEYLNSLYRLNEISFFESRGVKFTGTIWGVTDSGQLLIKSDHNVTSYDLKEIKYLND